MVTIVHICKELWKGLSFSLDLQAKKFAYHSSIDAGRGYETPGSEIKDFYYRSNSSHGISIFMSIFLAPLLQALIPKGWCSEGQLTLVNWIALQEKNPELNGIQVSYTVSLAALCLGRRHDLYLSSLFIVVIFLWWWSGTKIVPLLAWCVESWGTWKII